MYQSAQHMQEQLPSHEELSSRMRSLTLDLANTGLPELSSERARSSSPLTSPYLDKLQLTSPEIEELVTILYAPETPPSPTKLFSRTEETEQYASGYSNGLPHVQLQQQEQTHKPPQPALQQHATAGPDISDLNVLISIPGLSLPSTSKHSATGDDVKDMPQTVRTMGATPPPWSIGSEERSGKGSAPPTTAHQAPEQQMSSLEDMSSRKRTMIPDMDNVLSHQHNSKKVRMLQTVPRPGAEPPLSLTDMGDRQKTKLNGKRCRNQFAQAKCRQRQIDRIWWLQVQANVLRVEIARMKSTMDNLRYQLGLLT